MKPALTLIAAMDENRLLATSHGIPWHLPRDITHFRDYTRGKWLLLGRHTFDEMRGWFNETHTPLVLSSRCGYEPSRGRVVASVPQALAMAEASGISEVVCCGGSQTYAAAMPYAMRLVLTIIQQKIAADTGSVYFPKSNEAEWRTVASVHHAADAANSCAMHIVTLERLLS